MASLSRVIDLYPNLNFKEVEVMLVKKLAKGVMHHAMRKEAYDFPE